MAACCKKQGKTLCDRLHELYTEYGYYYDAQASYKLQGIAGLQATNLLKYKMKNGSWIAIRPSGTEPKLKMYCSLVEKNEAAAKKKFAVIRKNFEHVFDL